MIDLHFHALPGLDDGPAAVNEAVALVRAAAEQGTRTIVATPHVDFRHDVTLGGIFEAARTLHAALGREHVSVRLLVGGEIAPARIGELGEPSLAALRLGGGSHLLVECPHRGDEPGPPLEVLVDHLRRRGHGVLLAHPERCALFLADRERLRGLVGQGALCAVTAGSLAGGFGREPRHLALWLLEEGLAHVVCSDAHDLDRRPPGVADGLGAASEELSGLEALAPWLTEQVPRALLAGREMPPAPLRPRRHVRPRPVLGRLRRG